MSGPLGGVNPGNNAFAGASYTSAPTPVSVGGAFTSPAAGGGPPPSFGTAAAAFGRNNRGSNVQIPYSRVVPMHGKGKLLVANPSPDREGVHAYEYDGLHSGELAWVMTRTFKHDPPKQQGQDRQDYVSKDADNMPFAGTGPDRMQRMAYTSYMEAYFHQMLNGVSVDLVRESMGDVENGLGLNRLDSELKYYIDKFAMGNANLLALPDLAYSRQVGTQVAFPQLQGLFVMETGPFLRSYGVDREPVEIDTLESRTARFDGDTGATRTVTVDRHLGSQLAQRAFQLVLKGKGLLNWVPDGICLSKDDVGPNELADAEYNARMGALFNIGVQGPCITNTWVGDPEKQVMAMDKLFILIVGTLKYQTTTTKTRADAVKTLTGRVTGARFLPTPTPSTDSSAKSIYKVKQAILNQGLPASEEAQKKYNVILDKLDELYAEATNDKSLKVKDKASQFNVVAEELRAGKRDVSSAVLTDFRLMRATSSYLANRSRFVENTAKSRCGLKIGYCENGVSSEKDNLAVDFKEYADQLKELPDNVCNAGGGVAEYIVGGWCIGTVLDSAASRSHVHSQIRSAPASMAVNVNVNIEWWDADMLYQAYMDVDMGNGKSTTLSREETPFLNAEDAKFLDPEIKDLSDEDILRDYLGRGFVKKDGATYNSKGTYKKPDPKGVNSDATSEDHPANWGIELPTDDLLAGIDKGIPQNVNAPVPDR